MNSFEMFSSIDSTGILARDQGHTYSSSQNHIALT